MSKHHHHAEPGKPAKAAAEPADSHADAEAEALDPAALKSENAKLATQLAEAERRLKDADEQVRQYAGAFDKAKREFDAAKDRIAREYERNLKRDQTKAVSGLIGVLDTLDRSLDSVKGKDGDAFVDGVRIIRNQFDAALAAMGLLRFDGMGEIFDPERHQAVTTMAVADPAQAGRVIHSVAAGCIFGDEVVRPAMVVVGQGSDSDTSDTLN
ncbi:MAG: nucleotide exchange factor GrpE [Deltaproteobacteria bacterium]|nr:nucleotide exchange factor GrpE [Deltaproteobacteria bacterium]